MTRRQRNRRLGTAVLALALFAGTAGGLWAALSDHGRLGPKPSETTSPPVPTPSVRTLPVTRMTIVPGPADPPMPFVRGDQVVGIPLVPPLTLAETPQDPLSGWIAPVATLSNQIAPQLYPDDFLLYQSWTNDGTAYGHQSIRRHDLGSGADTVFEDRAGTFAWNQDGRVAYFRIMGHGKLDPPVGRVVVRYLQTEDPVSSPQVWTSEKARWIVAGWAGTHVLAYRELEGEALELWVLDGPGMARRLAPAGVNTQLVAISPDGTRAFVSESDGRDRAVVFEVATGDEVASFDRAGLRLQGQDGPVPAGYAGMWLGDHVVTWGPNGFVIYRVEADRITVETAVHLDGLDLYEPRFYGSPWRVVGWTRSGKGHAYVDCDIRARTCRVGPTAKRQNIYAVYTASRPGPTLLES